jgi:hypothetical protein
MPNDEALPPNYSPRDSMNVFRLPVVGETLILDSLSLRDFFFAAAMAKQEPGGKRLRVKPGLLIDEQPADTFSLTDFSLFKGKLDSIPPEYDFNWFFWDRLREYCAHTFKGKNFSLDFGLFDNDIRMTKYRVTKYFIFLLADDWRKGFDSRYFGPVAAQLLRGRPVCVLWSWDKNERGLKSLRIERFIKIVK